LVGSVKRKGPFRRPTCRWEDTIKVDLKAIGCGLDSYLSRWGLLVDYYEHGNASFGSIKAGKLSDWLSNY
jgi:hypothetical protein